MEHDVENDIVGEAHAVRAESADVVDGIFYVTADYPLAISQATGFAGSDEGIHRGADSGGDFGCAAALRAIAYHT